MRQYGGAAAAATAAATTTGSKRIAAAHRQAHPKITGSISAAAAAAAAAGSGKLTTAEPRSVKAMPVPTAVSSELRASSLVRHVSMASGRDGYPQLEVP